MGGLGSEIIVVVLLLCLIDKIIFVVCNWYLFFDLLYWPAVVPSVQAFNFGNVFMVQTSKIFTELMRKSTGNPLRHDWIQVAIELPVFELIQFTEQGLLIKRSIKVFLQINRIEAVDEFNERSHHAFENRIMMNLKILEDFLNSIDGADVLTFLADQQLHH